MKNLVECLREPLLESKWKSAAGNFNDKDAEKIANDWHISIKQVYKLCDAWDDQFGGAVEWDKTKYTFVRYDTKYVYNVDDEEWMEIKN